LKVYRVRFVQIFAVICACELAGLSEPTPGILLGLRDIISSSVGGEEVRVEKQSEHYAH